MRWSIKSSILESLKEVTRKLHVAIEAFGKEPGFMFQERFVIAAGIVFVDDCVEWKEIYLPDCSDETLEELSKESGLTVDEIKELSEQGDNYFEVGGYVDESGDSFFGVFCEELEQYLRFSKGEETCIA